MSDTLALPVAPTTVDAVVVVYLNTATDGLGRPVGMLDGYQPGHTLEQALEYRVRALPTTAGINAALEQVFFDLNVGDAPRSSMPRRTLCCSTAPADTVRCRSGTSSRSSTAGTPSTGAGSAGSEGRTGKRQIRDPARPGVATPEMGTRVAASG